MTIEYASDQTGYRAGACNIGPEEIARRRRGGLTGVGIAVAIGLISLEQVRRRFCVGFAMAGLRNFGPLGEPDKVVDTAERAADRRAALVMTAYMSAIAAVITALFVVLPV